MRNNNSSQEFENSENNGSASLIRYGNNGLIGNREQIVILS